MKGHSVLAGLLGAVTGFSGLGCIPGLLDGTAFMSPQKRGSYVFTCNSINDINKNSIVDGNHEVPGLGRVVFSRNEKCIFVCRNIGKTGAGVNYIFTEPNGAVQNKSHIVGRYDEYWMITYTNLNPGEYTAQWFVNGSSVGGSRVLIK